MCSVHDSDGFPKKSLDGGGGVRDNPVTRRHSWSWSFPGHSPFSETRACISTEQYNRLVRHFHQKVAAGSTAALNALILVRQLRCDVTCGRFEHRVKYLKQKEYRKLLPTSHFVR